MTNLTGVTRSRGQLEAVVIRADGTREDLGTIADSNWHWYSPRYWLAKLRTKRANRHVRSEQT